jgi:hypothetical protein
MLGCGGALALQHQPTMLLKKLGLLAAQLLAFVTILNRSKVLTRSENETASQNKTASEQERQTQKSAHVSFAAHHEVSLVQG